MGMRSIFAIALARVLVPLDFGMVAALAIVFEVAGMIVGGGFTTALIRQKELTPDQETSTFYFNVAVGCAASLVCFVAAPVVAAFYHSALLENVGRVLSINVLISATCAVHSALLMRRLAFFCLFKVSCLSVGLSGIVGLVMALLGCGVWSLVGQQTSLTGSNAVLLWWLSGWRPRGRLSFKVLRGMLGFGSSFLFIGLLDKVARNVLAVLSGHMFGMSIVGLYSRARQLEEVPLVACYSSLSDLPCRCLQAFKTTCANWKRV